MLQFFLYDGVFMAYHHNVVVKRKKRLIVLMMLDSQADLDVDDVSSDTAVLRQYLRLSTRQTTGSTDCSTLCHCAVWVRHKATRIP